MPSHIYYNIYFGSSSIPNEPNVVAIFTPIVIPSSLAAPGWQFDVRAAVGGITDNIEDLEMVVDGLYLFPSSVEITSNFNDTATTLNVDSTAGYPSTGYLLVGDEIIYYAVRTSTTFTGLSRGLYSTAILAYDVGTSVSAWRGVEAVGQAITGALSCGLKPSVWADKDKVGLLGLQEAGDGYTVSAHWGRAVPPDSFSVRYNVYQADTLDGLFSSPPSYNTAAQSIIVDGIRPGLGRYFMVRATYFLGNFTTNGMFSVGGNEEVSLYWPSPTSTSVPLVMGAIGTLHVVDTTGFPDSGLLIIGSEVVSYSSKTSDSFNVHRRDVFQIRWVEDYPAGIAVDLYTGIEDSNTVFLKVNTSHDQYGVDSVPLQVGDGYWGFQYLQDPDGYRNFPFAEFSEDHSIAEEDAESTDPFEYCGLRSNDQSQFLSGDFCNPSDPFAGGGGTYHGNSSLGQAGGINVFEGNFERQEMLLGITGAPFILLRRKWTGRTCRRLSHRNEHSVARCDLCFGTGFEGGFERHVHGRRLRPDETNPNGFVALRVDPYNDDLTLTDDRGLTLERTEISCWLPAVPVVKVRDVLVRYSFDYESRGYAEEFRYEVISVNRNQIVLGKDGAQKLTIRRLNKTEEVYKYQVNIL